MDNSVSPSIHCYNTRSSQSPAPVQVTQLYRMRVDILVKETVYSRDHNGKRLPPHIFEASSWESMKYSIFEHSRTHIVSMANYISDPREWSVSNEQPTVQDFDSFISIKMGRDQFKPINDTQAHNYLVDHVDRTFTVIIFKWGNRINSAADLQEFQRQCVAPQVQDRAGAAAEALHQQMVESLKTAWEGVYTAYEATWRMWASHILKRPTHEHEALISRHPPMQMIHLFESVPNGAQRRIEDLQRNLRAARDVVDACIEDVSVLMKDAENLSVRIKACFQMLTAKRDIIDSFSREVMPSDVDENFHRLLHTIPNVGDVEHQEESQEIDE
ncbi:hypothetical protein AeRB84_001503 [Aphanomyces euteiches]|nr:hypothetical protein AeRB84_001503 [Aphanomyces euteiches]